MKRWMMMLSFSAIVMGSALLGSAGCGSSTEGGDCAAATPASCPSDAPSYKTDVAPILASRCTSCHSATGVESGRPLDTYAGVNAQLSAVKGQIAGCEMPPVGSTALTEAEANTVLGWIVCGGSDN